MQGEQSNSDVTALNQTGIPKPAMSLLGAKTVMQQKLSAMYRGMRGLEAAHAAFAMCQVNIAVDVEDATPRPNPPAQRGKRQFAGKSSKRGAKLARVNEKQKKTKESRSKPEMEARVGEIPKSKETAPTDSNEGEEPGMESIKQMPSAE